MYYLYSFILTSFLLLNCSESKKEEIPKVTAKITIKEPEKPQTPICDSLKKFQTIYVAGRAVDIAVPTVPIKGNLLILQGFAFPKDDWCKKSSLCKKALDEGYVLIMPEMGKSNYMSHIYPELRADWKKEPQKTWLTDSVFSVLQKRYCLLLPNQKNYMIGLSTGARGVAVVALEHPTLFTAAAALSGDYEQSKIPQDRVHIGYMGNYQKFPKRWAEEENIVFQIAKWKTPIYLGHGMLDNVCPASQTKLFYDALKKYHPNLRVTLSMPANHTHDYKYWDWEVDKVLSFFR